MYPKKTIDEVYSLLLHFSAKIRIIKTMTKGITDALPSISEEWSDFFHYFNLGAYFHHRGQGYLECL
jgi:hypothetical protein